MTVQLQQLVINNDSNMAYFVQKNEQNNLKGLLWGTAGSAATGIVLSLTAGVIVGVPAMIITSAGAVINDSSRNLVGPLVPLVLFGAVTAAFLNKKIVQATGACFRNAIYHLGPECQIVAYKKNG